MGDPERAMGQDFRGEPPRLGRRLLGWFWALGLLALLAGGGYTLLLWEPDQLPVRVVTVDGEVRRLQPQRLKETVVNHINGGILTQDLGKLKTAVEAMPWVRSASLRRHWPDRLELEVVEQVAVARWGENALVSADGVIFKPEVGDFPRRLPKLSGPKEHVLQLVERLQSWGPRLEPLGLKIEELADDARGAWTLHLSSGFTLALGKAKVEERLSRFLRVYPKVAAPGMPAQVDMRYSNGLAIRWLDEPGECRDSAPAEASRSAKSKSRPAGFSRS